MRGEIRTSGGTNWREALEEISRRLPDSRLEAIWKFAEKLLGKPDSTDDGMLLLLHLSVLAAQYGEEKLALRWVDRHERASSGSHTPATRLHDVIRIAVNLASKDYPAVERRSHGIDWDSLPDTPWLKNIRLLLVVRARDWRGALDLLRGPLAGSPGAPSLVDPYDRGNCLRILGIHFFQSGRWEKGMGLFRAALREFAGTPGIHARLKEVELLGAAGTEAYQGGRLDEAEELLTRAIGEAEEHRHAFYRDRFRHELALVLADREELPRAEEILLDIAEAARLRGPTSGSDHFLRVAALLTAAGVALDRRDREAANQHLETVGQLLEGKIHPRYQGYLQLGLGRLAGLTGPGDGASKALEHFSRAEHHFATFGDGDLVGLAKVHLYRGCLHLKLKDVRSALAEAIDCSAAAARSHYLPLQSRSLLLKSRILLEQETPEPIGLYEEILGKLGVVHSPALLFQVIANLYFYSWDLDNHLDLTDYHMQQIQKFAEILDEQTFHRLYRAHVLPRFVRRLATHTFDMDPDLFEPET